MQDSEFIRSNNATSGAMSHWRMNKQAALERFRAIPEKSLGEWRYRAFGAGARTFLMIPGAELVNDLAFQFALAIGEIQRVIYPA